MANMIFQFPEIKGNLCTVKYSGDRGKSWKSFEVQVKDNDLKGRKKKYLPPISADLIDLGTSIFIADWLSTRKLHEEPTKIEVRIPLRKKNLFSKKKLKVELEYLLNWFTEDHWKFNFQTRKSKRDVERQPIISFDDNSKCEVALWSGGLDSLAGLYYRYKKQPQVEYLLVGTGFNKRIIGKQKTIFEEVKGCTNICAFLRQVPFYLQNTSDKQNHPYMRSRGLSFMLIGAATSLSMKQQVLHIYENGIGALNLPYRRSEVGLDHTRSVHPISLIKVSSYLSNLTNEKFRIHNPFVFKTKAQMCTPIVKDGYNDLVFKTKTCDSPHRTNPPQCGYCSSCLLRRQSILFNGIQDNTGYVLTDGNPRSTQLKTHLEAVLNQVRLWERILQKNQRLKEVWSSAIEAYPNLEITVAKMSKDLSKSKSDIKQNIISMYKSYCKEWNKCREMIIITYPAQSK